MNGLEVPVAFHLVDVVLQRTLRNSSSCVLLQGTPRNVKGEPAPVVLHVAVSYCMFY